MMSLPDTRAVSAPPVDDGADASRPFARFTTFMWDHVGVLVVLGALVAYLTITQENFATSANLLNIAQTNAVLLTVAVGMTFVLLVGGFDLSLGAMVGFASIILAELLGNGVPVVLAMALVVLGGALLGLLTNGLLIAKVGLSFLVVTLGVASILLGVANVRTDGQSQSLFDVELLVTIGSGEVWGVPWIVVISLVVFLLAAAVLRYTGYGRMVYATGGNEDAARLAGINTVAIRASAYAIAAGCAALAGVLNSGRLASASPTAGAGIELVAGAAVLIGGTTFYGGQGGVSGTLLGVLFLGVLSNGITLAGVASYYQSIVSGAVLIAAVAVDRVRSRR